MSIRIVMCSTLLGLAAVAASRGFAGVATSSSVDPPRRDAPTAEGAAGVGADVTVVNIGLSQFGTDDYPYWGESDGIRTFSAATTACNLGDAEAEWYPAPDDRHPLIAQNLYRYLDGRFEQVGMSWVKHTFCAINEPGCTQCQETPCETLGVGCADTYWGFLNGDPARLGPRSEIDPQGTSVSGTHVQPHALPAEPHLGRLAVHEADLANATARYVVEAQYVTHDEALDHRYNNTSWREVTTTLDSFTNVDVARTAESGIHAWAEFDAGVDVQAVDVAGDGRMHVGCRVTDNGDGTWHYEYAVHNMSVDRAAASVQVPVRDCVDVTNVGFHDVDYHSGDGEGLPGENYDGTDWPDERDTGTLTWETDAFADDPNANALRWGTVYNFRLDADRPPTVGTMTIGLFKPGGEGAPDEVTLTVQAPSAPPSCAADCGQLPGCGDGEVDVVDLLAMLGQWGVSGPCDIVASGTVDVEDLLAMLGQWGKCQ